MNQCHPGIGNARCMIRQKLREKMFQTKRKTFISAINYNDLSKSQFV